MALSNRLKTILVLVLSSVSVCLGILNLADRASWQQETDGIQWRETARGLVVGSLTPEVARVHPGLKRGDLLVGVNDIPVGGLDDLIEIREFLSDRFPARITARYTFQKASGEEVTYPIAITYQSTIRSRDYFLSGVAFGFLFIGLFIFLRHWQAASAFHFYLICQVACVVLLFRHSGRADAFDQLIFTVDALSLILLPPVFLHFCLLFPQPGEWARSWRSSRYLIYMPALMLGALFLLWLPGWLQPVGFPRTEATDQLQMQFHLLHFIALFLLGSLALAHNARASKSSIQRQQMKWITHGTFVALLPFLGLYAIPYLAGWPIYTWMEASVTGLILIPLSFGYAITRYRLMDVDLIFKKSAAYLLATSLVLGLYMAIVVIVGRGVESLSGGSGILVFALTALVMAFLFAPLKNRIQVKLDRSFYKERYDYRQSFADFGTTLNSEVDLPRLTDKLSRRILKTLDLSPVGIFLRDDPRTSIYHLYEARGLENVTDPLLFEIPDDVLLRLKPSFFALFPEAQPEEVGEIRGALRDLGFYYVQPLRVHDRSIGFLALGRRNEHQLLNSEDVQLLEALAGYAAIAINNAVLYRSLEAKASEFAELKIYSDKVIESITVGVMVMSSEGEITIWNSTMESICGTSAQQAVGKNVERVLPKQVVETLRPFFGSSGWSARETRRIFKTHLRSNSGEIRMVNITLAPFVSTHDIPTGTLLIFDDITEKVRLEDQLLQSEKLSSIGLFAAGLAHEVNTPLAGISSYVQMLIKETEEEDPRADILRRVEQQSMRASHIINNLLNFARISEREFGEVNLNSLMLETLSLLDHPFRKGHVEVKMDLDPSLPATMGNGGKLQQVFMNLFLNARDAMPEGGELRLKTYSRESSVVIEVADTGHGISDEHVKRIYDPFFTTKEVSKGTGLGLSVSYGIIQEHSGRISVDSSPGKGTRFTLELPLKRIN